MTTRCRTRSVRRPGSDGAVVLQWLPSTERAVAERIWSALEEQLGRAAPTTSWSWTDAWLSAYGDLVPHRFAVAEFAGEPCGVVLVTKGVGRRHGPFPVRTVHLGTAGEPPGEGVYVEYNRVLVDPQHRAAFATALVQDLRRDSSWHELHLDGFAPEDAEPFLATEPALEARRVPSPCTTLRGALVPEGDVVAALRPSTRRKVRRSAEVLPDLAVEWAETPAAADDVLSELMVLHQRRWTAAGQPGAFSAPRFVAFHRDLVARLLPSARVLLLRVSSGGRTVGCLYHLVEGDRVLFYQSGFAQYDDKRVTPGFVTFALCMQACAERGFVEYDFLAGASRYKRELSNTTRELVWATEQRPALRWSLARGAGALRARARGAAQRGSA